MLTRTAACFLALLLTTAYLQAESPAAKDTPVATLARQAWAITDLVLEQDLDPPARQQMLLLGLKALLRDVSKPIPATLPERLSTVTTVDQFAALLSEVWPTEEARPHPGEEGREQVLMHGLMAWRPRKEQFESSYLSPRELKIHDVIAGNRYVGTGIQIRMHEKENLTQIMVPFPGGPARKAGARPGDLIIEVDGVSMAGKPLSEVVRRLQGEEGTKVSMTVKQPGESKTRLLPMVRSVIPFSSLQGFRRTGEESWSWRPDPKSAIAYLAVTDIKSSTPLELRQIEPLVKDDGAKALIVDLRFTQGQDMNHGALVADSFLDGGTFWRVKDRQGRVKEYKADRDCLFRDLPMVVLIGPHTGSVAALLAAALQDRDRAILVGQPSEAEVLLTTSLVRLPAEQGALLLRTGTLERSPRKSTQTEERQRLAAADKRLVPDHLVDFERKELFAVEAWQRQQESPEPKADAKPPADPQLEKALALLRETLTQREKKTKD